MCNVHVCMTALEQLLAARARSWAMRPPPGAQYVSVAECESVVDVRSLSALLCACSAVGLFAHVLSSRI